ncbi:MAG TPA: monooxygenase, partial [Burkholderiales bacterium]|nr:monooxygenase [Burkholderiales bacterium]
MRVVDEWLAKFDRAIGDPSLLDDLFHADSHWRDILALTWRIQTVSGRSAVVEGLQRRLASAKPSGFRVDPKRTEPREVTRAGTKAIEAIFRFETAQGRGSGVVRLLPPANGGAPKAWTLLTALDELNGVAETIGSARPKGESYSRDFRGPNWLDLRTSAAEYADRDPAVLVVGGGQAGLSIAARL